MYNILISYVWYINIKIKIKLKTISSGFYAIVFGNLYCIFCILTLKCILN